MHHPTDRIAHTMAFVTPVVEHWLEWEIRKERRKMFYLTMHSTHFYLWLCGDHSDSERGNLLLTLHGKVPEGWLNVRLKIKPISTDWKPVRYHSYLCNKLDITHLTNLKGCRTLSSGHDRLTGVISNKSKQLLHLQHNYR